MKNVAKGKRKGVGHRKKLKLVDNEAVVMVTAGKQTSTIDPLTISLPISYCSAR